MHNTAPVLENDTHKHLWDFNLQTDTRISTRRPDLIKINKKKRACKIVDIAGKRRISNWTSLRNWKTMEHEGDNYTNRNWCFSYSNQGIIKGTGGLGNKRMSGDQPNYNIIVNSENTEKNLRGD